MVWKYINIFGLFRNIGKFIDKLLNKIKPIIVRNSIIPQWFSTKKQDMYGITFFPFIFLIDFENTDDEVIYKPVEIINHEKIHFQQILETGIIGFYILFFIELICKSIKNRSIKDGYLDISFEVEAYKYMEDLDYLTNRRRYRWIKYIL